MDTLVRALELGAKYAWAAFTVSALVLLAPDGLAGRLELLDLRRANAPYLWLIFLFSGTLAVGTALPVIRHLLWRFVLCPLKKLAFPIIDARSDIRQGRIRYYRVQFSYRNGDKPIYYLAITSNGTSCGFYDERGRRVLPIEPNDGHVMLEGGRFQYPSWGRIDWQDVFNGQSNSGVWGIIER